MHVCKPDLKIEPCLNGGKGGWASQQVVTLFSTLLACK